MFSNIARSFPSYIWITRYRVDDIFLVRQEFVVIFIYKDEGRKKRVNYPKIQRNEIIEFEGNPLSWLNAQAW